MCRIFGASYGAVPEDLTPGEIAERLFPAFVKGGPHAYGYMQYQPGEGITFDKWAGRSDTDEAMDNVYYGIQDDAEWWVGHVRYLTHGPAENRNNNHPIPHGNIIGVHNGVLENHEEILRKTGRQNPDTQVDSEAIFAAVNKWGPRKGLRRVKGKMVAIFADNRMPGKLRIARSHSRTLYVAWTERGNFIFGSEREPIEELTIESDIKFRKFSNVGEYRIITVEEGAITQRGHYLDSKQLLQAQAASALRQMRQTERLSVSKEYTSYDEWVANRAAQRALKRGEMVFGYDDVMMTTEEYLEHLSDLEELPEVEETFLDNEAQN